MTNIINDVDEGENKNTELIQENKQKEEEIGIIPKKS